MTRGKTSGNLKTYSLPRLLCFAQRKQFSGALVIHEKRDTMVSFHQGSPIYCDRVNQDDLLGKLLVRAALTNPETVKDALAQQQSDARPIGAILRERGVSTQGLFEVLKIQQKRKILRLFLLDREDFSFEPGSPLPPMAEELADQRLDGLSLAWQGLVSIKTPDALERDLRALEDMALRCSHPVQLPDPKDGHHLRAMELLAQRHWSLDQLHRAVGKRRPVLEVLHYLWAMGVLQMQPLTQLGRARERAVQQGSATPGGPANRRDPRDSPQAPPRMTSMFRSVAEAAPSSGGPQMESPDQPPSPAQTTASKRAASRELPALPEDAPPEARALHEELRARLSDIADQDLFEVLGLPHEATKAQVKNAYIGLAKKFHPDRVASLGVEALVEPADRLFQRISEAFTTLMNDSQREEYRRIIEDTSLQGDRQAAQRVMEAEVNFQKGEVFFRKGDLDQAETFFAKAVDGNPEEGEHLAMLTWVRHMKARQAGQVSQAGITETRQTLEQAKNLSPKCPRIYYFLGKILQEEKRPDSALESFRMALRLNKHYVEAAREIHIMELRMARNDKPTKSSLWDKLRGK